MRAPEFWNRNDPLSRLAVALLAPVGSLYGATVEWNSRNAVPWRAPVPVICAGNLTAGGTGKTPVAIAVADALRARGRRPFFLTRGYGGRARGPLPVAPEHSAAEVGDEALLLAATAPTIVSGNRQDGAHLAVEHGADVIVMDDGHQNFSLVKNLSIVVVDAQEGFGNGRILPAGPLREAVRAGLARADAVVLMGDGTPQLDGFEGTVLRARLEPADASVLKGKRVVAFAGIGRPEKFFDSLRRLGAELVAEVPFGDHHVYTTDEIADLKAKARGENALLVTTEKDQMRLTAAEREGIAVLRVKAVIEEAGLGRLLDSLRLPR
jgi:tetraacyldisaccharide 4'-kinase